MSGVDHPAVYYCTSCRVAAPVIVSGLTDHDSVDLLDQSTKRALMYATCPRCGERNPEGVAEHAKSRRSGRVIGTLASLVMAIGVWFLPWLAYVVLAIVIGMTVLMFVFAGRARTLRVGAVVYNLAFAAVLVAVVWFYPRASALVPLVLAVRFAISGGESDSKWTNAKETLRFDTSYR
jgi:hypothetical protein